MLDAADIFTGYGARCIGTPTAHVAYRSALIDAVLSIPALRASGFAAQLLEPYQACSTGGLVYFARAGRRVKIGSSAKPALRCHGLSQGRFGSPHELLLVVGKTSQCDEQALHRVLGHERQVGEYFNGADVETLLSIICAMSPTFELWSPGWPTFRKCAPKPSHCGICRSPSHKRPQCPKARNARKAA